MHDATTTTTRASTTASVMTTIAAVAGAFALAVALIAVVIAVNDGGGGTVTAGEPETVEVSLAEFQVTPATIELAPGTPLTLVVTNDGTMPHDLKLGGTTGTGMLAPGDSETVELGPIEADSQAWCTVPGHREAGMVLTITTTGTGGGTAAGRQGTGTDDAAAGDAAQIDFAAEPGPEWQPFDPTLQPAAGGGEHHLEFSAEETVIEVAPGVTQELWTFNGQFPGPILRGKVGDLFTITLTNNGTMGHSIDFHASRVAWNDEMRTIQPGESLTYQFRAEHAGAFMYHCGTAPALHHIGNGMFGAIIIDPPNLAPVDHEYIFVQSELYPGPEGGPGDLTRMQNEDFAAVVFNGYVNQYFHAPIQVEPGERVRAWVVDAGPSENSSFHIVGTVFDTMFKEGAYTLQPSDGLSGGAQALDLQPAQGGFVEFSFAEPGLYPIVTHKFANVGKGALGLFQAGDGGPAVAGGH